jgi:hypothetical protein
MEQACETRSGLQEFHPPSAARTFRAAVLAVKGGSGGCVSISTRRSGAWRLDGIVGAVLWGRAAFETEMRTAKAGWQMELYGGTVHSFTSRDASRRGMPDKIRYSLKAEARSSASMLALFATALA